MEREVTYDEASVRNVEMTGSTRQRKRKEVLQSNISEEVAEGKKIAIRISATETLAGIYALLLTSLGLAFPVAEFTSRGQDLRMKNSHDTGFELFVFIVSLLFQIYISCSVKIYTWKNTGKLESSQKIEDPSNTEIETDLGGTYQRRINSKGEIYVVDTKTENGQGTPNNIIPWHAWHKVAPCIYEIKYGFNLFTRIGVLVFGLSGVAQEICHIVEYDRSRYKDMRCRDGAALAVVIIRMIFFIVQSIFLIIHHKLVFNFHHPLIKFGLLHMVATNLILWIKTVAQDGVGFYVLFQELEDHHTLYKRATKNHTEEVTMAEYLCLDKDSINFRSSFYLSPLIIGYCVLAASILYKKYSEVGPSVYMVPARMEVWEREGTSSSEEERPRWGRPNIGLILGAVLLLVTCGLTGWLLFLQDWRADNRYVETMGQIHIGCDLTLNIITLIALVPAFYYTSKLPFKATPNGLLERMFLGTLGGMFFLLGFMTHSAFFLINDSEFGGPAKMAVPGCILNFIQASAMYVYVMDAWRRRLASINQNHGKDCVTFLIFANVSIWLVTSFQWKLSFGSFLFLRSYGLLPWVLIVNSALPLAMFFRYIVCLMLMEMLRKTYGLHLRRWFCFFSTETH